MQLATDRDLCYYTKELERTNNYEDLFPDKRMYADSDGWYWELTKIRLNAWAVAWVRHGLSSAIHAN